MKLTPEQKLAAIENRFYNHQSWLPKLNDYYTLTRSSMGMELFQIVTETETQFGIKLIYSDSGASQDEPTMFDKTDFLEGFGICRVHVPEYILNT